MAKRRRMLHEEANDVETSGSPEQSPNAPLHYTRHGQDLAYPGQHAAHVFSSPTSNGLTERPGVAQTVSSLSKQWDPHHAQPSSPYPDMASCQQPYFFQQTDPSIYEAPWPPAAAPGTIFAPSNAAGPLSQSGFMPFFPGSSVTTDRLEGAASFQHGYEEPISVSHESAVLQSTVQSPGASSMYHEDASMHLKIQSLTILDSLVRLINQYELLTC